MVLTVYLKHLVRLIVLFSKYNGVLYGHDKPYFVCTHSVIAGAGDRNRNHDQAYLPGPVFSYKLRYIVGFWLVKMAISTNQKPTIYRNLYENTGPGTEDIVTT